MSLDQFRRKLECSKIDPGILETCLKVTEVLSAIPPGDGQHLGPGYFIQKIPGRDYKENLLPALNVLCTAEDAILSMHGYVDTEEGQHHLTDDEFREALAGGKLADPKSGNIVPNPMKHVRIFFSLEASALRGREHATVAKYREQRYNEFLAKFRDRPIGARRPNALKSSLHLKKETGIDPRKTTIAELLKWFGEASCVRILRWIISRSHAERLRILEEFLDDAYGKLVDNRAFIARKDRNENEITASVVNMLALAGLSVRQETYVNGLCDIVVEHRRSGFRWLGEAKIYTDSYAWLQKGFDQLSARYGTALPGKDYGELIIYNRAGNSTAVLERWRDRMERKHGKIAMREQAINALFFRTRHSCENSGRHFHIRHRIVPLRHSPKE